MPSILQALLLLLLLWCWSRRCWCCSTLQGLLLLLLLLLLLEFLQWPGLQRLPLGCCRSYAAWPWSQAPCRLLLLLLLSLLRLQCLLTHLLLLLLWL
jgi:hypothetical protein